MPAPTDGKRRRRCAAMIATLATLAGGSSAHAAEIRRSGEVYVRVSEQQVVLGNRSVERRWDRRAFATTALFDRRGRDRRLATRSRDFTLSVSGVELTSEAFRAEAVSVRRLARGGLRVTMRLVPASGAPPEAGGLKVTRVAEAYPGVAGFRTQTVLRSSVPLTLTAATLEEAAVGRARPTIHAFRAGSDWREPGYEGPPVSVGDAHGGSWRRSKRAARGAAIEGPAQWLSAATRRRRVFMVMERNDFPSSRAAYDGRVARLRVEYTRDVLVLGPLEENAHLENPSSGAGRQRIVSPGVAFPLESTFTGIARGGADEAWQHHLYLAEHRMKPYRHDVTFNSNGVDRNRISTGAKDDMDLATVTRVARIARRLGVETFILDDGWQARSGDWQPDSPQFTEPRYDGSADSPFSPRFPDSEFRAVRRAIAPMRLGLWMSPLEFHPSSRAFASHPGWLCQPTGQALLAYNTLEPYESSNEAGIVPWSEAAIPHVESRIRDAIENWGVRYWKFDFMVWLDCAGENDLYELHDAFVAMIDRLQRDHPRVTFQIDETNDYRLFPYESVTRGPSWFQNGTPEPRLRLHNLWNLSPYVPAFSLGQDVLGGEHFRDHPVSTLMAAAYPSHITFFSDIRELPGRVVRAAGRWISFYKRHRRFFDGVTYPLLADPLEDRWTALQSWDPRIGRGSLLAFRQDGATRERKIRLRNVPPGRRFALIRAPDGRRLGTVRSARLRRGLPVEIGRRRGAQVLLIRPARERPRPAPVAAQPGKWLAGDLHVHTTYSHDSYGGPSDDNTEAGDAFTLGHSVSSQFAVAASRGLDYLAITDHEDIRSQSDPGFGSEGVLGLPGYENSLEGHAQMLGARRIYRNGDASAPSVRRLARRLRSRPDRGVFQINHPAEGSTEFPHDADWGYGYGVRPDSVEVWSISRLYQPPFPSASSNDDAIRYWEGWLDRGRRVAATGGSDNHYLSTTAAQGVGQPTTWVHARRAGRRAILKAIRAGQTFISDQPPAYGGPQLFLEADRNRDGRYESIVGDAVRRGAPLRVRATGAAGTFLRVITDGGQQAFRPLPVTGARFEHRFRLPLGADWVRAEIFDPDLAEERHVSCDHLLGDQTTYCRNRLLVRAMTSAIYLCNPDRRHRGGKADSFSYAAARHLRRKECDG